MHCIYLDAQYVDNLGNNHKFGKFATKMRGNVWAWVINESLHMVCDSFTAEKEFNKYITTHNLSIIKI